MKKYIRVILIVFVMLILCVGVINIIYNLKDKNETPNNNGKIKITIGDNGNWYVDDVDTNVSSYNIGNSKSRVLTGIEKPIDGNAYDIYVDLNSFDFYLFIDDTWELRGNIKEKPQEVCYQGDLELHLLEDGTYGVYKCTNENVKEIFIPAHYNKRPITKLMEESMFSCSKLKHIEIPNTINEIGIEALNLSNLECNEYESSQYIGNKENPYLVLIYSKNTMHILEDTKVLYSSYLLNHSQIELIISDNNKWFKSIDGNLFNKNATKIIKYCSNNLNPSYIIPDSVTSVGDYAFAGCRSLTNIEIPNNVTSIGERAFFYCDSLTSIVISSTVSSIGVDAFLACSKLKQIDVSLENKNYISIDGNLYTKDEITLIQYAIGKQEKSFNVPNSVRSIGDYAFYGCNSLENIVISDSVTNSVRSIGDYAFYGCNSLENIVISDSVTNIGENAFASCYNLEQIEVSSDNRNYMSIDGNLYTKDGKTLIQYAIGKQEISFNIPTSVTSIGDLAFAYCVSITSIVIPDSVTSIGERAFNYCKSLTSIVIPNSVTSIGERAFYGCDSLTSIVIPNSVTSIGDSAFDWCTSLTSIVIPNSVTSIGERAFYGCDSLTSIVIPNSVTSIGDSAFDWCTSLTSIVIPNSVTSIGERAFNNCNSLTSIVIPNSVTSIGDSAFSSCNNLTSIVIPNSVTSIGANAFYGCNNLTSIVIPNSVTSIGDSAFSSCNNLTSIVIPNSVTSIGERAFYGCNNLTSIVIPNSVTSIGERAFASCNNLKQIDVSPDNRNYMSIDGNLYTKDGKTLIQYAIGKQEISFNIPTSVTSIGDLAFAYCVSITSIVIPDSVTSIGERAFYYCNSLTSIVIPNSVTSIGTNAFCDCNSLTSIVIPNSVTSIGERAFYACSKLKQIDVSPDNRNYMSIDGNLYTKDGKTLIQYAIGKQEISFNIPTSVTTIGDSAFCFCRYLTSIVIPNSVKTIEDSAFYYCRYLTSIVIPNSVTSIGDSVFEYCRSLTSIVIPDSVTNMGERVFEYCDSLTIYCEATSKPSGWAKNWIIFTRPVVWGYNK